MRGALYPGVSFFAETVNERSFCSLSSSLAGCQWPAVYFEGNGKTKAGPPRQTAQPYCLAYRGRNEWPPNLALMPTCC